jgi:hypothetical protein
MEVEKWEPSKELPCAQILFYRGTKLHKKQNTFIKEHNYHFYNSTVLISSKKYLYPPWYS